MKGIKMLKKLVGTKEFYKSVLAICLPIMLQNGITNFVNMLDNLMVGRLGNAEMTGVSIANQLIFVFSLCVFGEHNIYNALATAAVGDLLGLSAAEIATDQGSIVGNSSTNPLFSCCI